MSHPRSLLLELEEEPQDITFFLVLFLSVHFAPEVISLISEAAVDLKNVMHTGAWQDVWLENIFPDKIREAVDLETYFWPYL